MAMTFVVDSLVQFDIPAYLLELLLSFDERAKIVTLGYQPKNFFGRFKNHQVVASSINRWIQEPQDLKHRWWLAPSATNTIPFEKGDTLVVISTGIAHSIIPEQYRAEAYLYLFDWQKLEKNLWSSLFNPFVEKWRQDSLKSFKNVAIAHHDFKDKFAQSVFLGPTLPTSDFFIPTDEIQTSKHLIHTEGLTGVEVDFFEQQSGLTQYFGNYKNEIFKNIDENKFLGDHCDGTLQSYQLQSKVIWDLSASLFPYRALKAQLAGKMVIVREGVDTSFLHPEGFLTLPKSADLGQIKSVFQKAESMGLGVDRNQLRRSALKWNERFFKTQFQYFLRGELS